MAEKQPSRTATNFFLRLDSSFLLRAMFPQIFLVFELKATFSPLWSLCRNWPEKPLFSLAAPVASIGFTRYGGAKYSSDWKKNRNRPRRQGALKHFYSAVAPPTPLPSKTHLTSRVGGKEKLLALGAA